LPSVILNDQILKPLLSLDVSKPSDQKKIDFFKNGPEILSQLNHKKIGFWLKPITVEDTFKVA